MLPNLSHLDNYRVKQKGFESPLGAPYGMFIIPVPGKNYNLQVIAASGSEEHPWDHVSVCRRKKANGDYALPDWADMCSIKELFFEFEEEAVQYHPKRSDYVNTNPFVLHLWRPIKEKIPMPPKVMV